MYNWADYTAHYDFFMADQKKTILVVLSHPDDESFGMGGTIAHYAAQGVDVHLICATRGELGDVDPELLEGYGSVGELREAELMCAAGELGLASVNFLDYRDSGMAGSEDNLNPSSLHAAPLDEVTAKVVEFIRKFQPQIVITFDPAGGYHHPDHIAIHQATQAAFHAAGNQNEFPSDLPAHQPDKLYFTVFPRRYLRFAIRALRLLGKDPKKFGRNQDIDLEMLAGDQDYPIHARINYRKVSARKESADRCHASQLDFGSGSRLFTISNRLLSGKDYFMRAHPPVEGNRRVVNDLFQG